MRLAALFYLLCVAANAAPIGFSERTIPGLIGWWTLNEGTGAIAADYSGGARLACISNAPAWTNAVIKTGLRFSGSTQVAAITNNLALGGANAPVSYNVWMNFAGTASTYVSLVSKVDNSAGGRTCDLLIHGGKLAFYLGKSDGSGNYIFIDANGGPVFTNAWEMVTATYDGSTMMTYTNGVSDYTKTGQTLTWGLATTNITIGNSPVANRAFPGSIDDVRIYNRALTAAEVRQLYNGGAGSQH